MCARSVQALLEGACMPNCLSGAQRTTLWSSFCSITVRSDRHDGPTFLYFIFFLRHHEKAFLVKRSQMR